MKHLSLFILFLLLGSCSHKDNKKLTFEEAMKREAVNLAEQEVTSEDGELSLKAKANEKIKIERFEGALTYYFVTIDVGADAPVSCYLYPASVGLGLAIKRLSGTVLKSHPEKNLAQFGAGVVDTSPYLLMNTGYKSAGGKVGFLKAMAGEREGSTTVCLHDEFGFNQTFLERFTEVMRTHRFKALPKLDVLYHEVLLFQAQNVPVGYLSNTLVSGTAKTKLWIQRNSLIFPKEKGDVGVADAVTKEVSAPDGSLKTGIYEANEDESKVQQLEVSGRGNSYWVQGIINGNKVMSSIKAELYSQYKHTELVRTRLFEKKQKKFSLQIYEPSVDAFNPTTLRTKVVDRKPKALLLELSASDEAQRAIVDPDGSTRQMSFPIENLEVVGKRVVQTGKL